jgi:hypothetical protein
MDETTETAEPRPTVCEGPTTIDTKELKKRFDQQKSARGPVEGVWRQIALYFAPLGTASQAGSDAQGENTVAWTQPDVWDSTAIDSSEKLIAMIHGNVTSPALRWYGLGWRDKDLKADQEARKWLDAVADISWQTLQDSDFNTEIACAHGDLVRFGNAVIIEEAASSTEWKGVDFQSVPLDQCYFEPDSVGQMEVFYQLLSWSAVQVMTECRKRGWTCPEEIEEEAKKGTQLDKRYPIVFCIFPRWEAQTELERRHERNARRAKERAEREQREQQREAALARFEGDAPAPAAEPPIEPDEPTYPLAPHLRGWGYVYFRADTGDRIGMEGGYYEMPGALARWAKTAGSIWGHGQCHVLLPTVKYLNGWMETEHQAAAKAVDPNIYTTERGLLSDHDSQAGGITVARSKNDVWTLDTKAEPTWANMKLEELRGMVRRGLHNDELTLKDSPAMTAQEVRARYEIMQRILGSTLARIENELLSPIIKITIGHLLRNRQLPEMPPKVAEKYAAGTLEINIEYQGPLARSQRTDEVAAIERVIALAGAWIQMGIPVQVVMAKINVLASLGEVATRLGTPASLLRSDEEAEKEVQKFFAEQARGAAAVAAKAEGEAAAAHATARAALMGGAGAGGGGSLPVPAMPTPVVRPAFPPTAPPT